MDSQSSLDMKPDVINQRESNGAASTENIAEKYNVQIYEDESIKQLNDNEQIAKRIYSNDDEYNLNTVEYLMEPYFTEVQKYPLDSGINSAELGNKIFLGVIFIQLLIIFYFTIMYIKKRRQKNENIHNMFSKVGAK